jgi:hypothetical protein
LSFISQPVKPRIETERLKPQEASNDPPKKKLKPSIAANLDLLTDKQKLEILKTLENEPEVCSYFIVFKQILIQKSQSKYSF